MPARKLRSVAPCPTCMLTPKNCASQGSLDPRILHALLNALIETPDVIGRGAHVTGQVQQGLQHATWSILSGQ